MRSNSGVLVLVLVLVLVVGCSGRIDEPVGRTASYMKAETTTLPASGPTSTWTLAVSCDVGDVVVNGGCELGAGGALVQNERLEHGWTCAARTERDDVAFRAWVECAAP